MMGAFAEWQPRYAEHGVSTFPVTADKTPAIKGYLKVGRKGSEQLALKFPGHEAFGVACKANRLTVLDVDTPDERVLADALGRHGDSPFIVQSGSGNFQAWYRHNGEPRRVRPDPSRPIDILGNGFVVAPPSLARKGRYEIIRGSLDDLASLPKMRGVAAPDTAIAVCSTIREEATVQFEQSGKTVGADGRGRNNALWRHCMKAARSCRRIEDLMDIAMKENATGAYAPLPAEEVLKIVASAWGYEVEGKNRFGYGPRIILDADDVHALAASDPKAFALLSILQLNHNGTDDFVVANAMAGTLGWTLRAFTKARASLLESGFIECVHPGGKGPSDPPIYRFPTPA